MTKNYFTNEQKKELIRKTIDDFQDDDASAEKLVNYFFDTH